MLKVNKNLSEAMNLLNGFNIPRTEVVLNRIFSKPGASYKELFTTEELKKFNKQMQISDEQICSIVNAFSYILMFLVAERDLKIVESVLIQSGLVDRLQNRLFIFLFVKNQGIEKYQIFNNLWLQYGNEYTIKIREQPVAVCDVLHSFNWNMSLQIEESRLPLKNAANLMNVEGKIDNCEDLFSYDARNPAVSFIFVTKQSGDEHLKEKFTIKFQKQDVQNLFEQLEIIQDNIDMLL